MAKQSKQDESTDTILTKIEQYAATLRERGVQVDVKLIRQINIQTTIRTMKISSDDLKKAGIGALYAISLLCTIAGFYKPHCFITAAMWLGLTAVLHYTYQRGRDKDSGD